jgi:ABC-type antimicrobial peptide transport system permease subunit
MRETLGMAALGAAIGAALTFALSRLVEGLLFGVRPQNPAVLTAAVAAMIVVAAVAGYLPARRATTINPMTALRWE